MLSWYFSFDFIASMKNTTNNTAITARENPTNDTPNEIINFEKGGRELSVDAELLIMVVFTV